MEIERLKKLVDHTRMFPDAPTIWLPKVICIFSPYLFYDKYKVIIENLVEKLTSGSEGLPNLFEALIFEIVCTIETPVRKPVLYKTIEVKSSSTSYNLPYISDSFFNLLL